MSRFNKSGGSLFCSSYLVSTATMERQPPKSLKVALEDPRISHLVSCPALKTQEPIYDYTASILESLRIKSGVCAVC